MAGWSRERANQFLQEFRDFLSLVRIDSKETGGEQVIELYSAQEIFLRGLMDGLVDDIHDFTILKARQLGITTISYLFTIFYVSIFKGIKGAIIFDKDDNKEDFRKLLTRAIDSLRGTPYEIRLSGNDRYGITFANGSRLGFMVAGVKKTKTSGGLGRSRGLNYVHATEMSSWGDLQGVVSLRRSLAQKYENRVFIWESTARGFNLFERMWREAKADDLAQRAIFIGWWAKEEYRIERDHPLFERYGLDPPTQGEDSEQEKIDQVKTKYGWVVTQEQLAWYRHEFDPTNIGEDDIRDDDDIIKQELPWTEEEAFIMSGSSFFPNHLLTKAAIEAKKTFITGYRFVMGEEFKACRVIPVKRYSEAELKVWEEPVPGAVYVLSGDPAYASSETSDRYCAQVLRCYADGIDQVAEYCVRNIMPYQFTWVLAHLAGSYGNCRVILELNGPGEAVFTGFRELEQMLAFNQMPDDPDNEGLLNMFRHVRQYLYKRRDSIGGNYMYQWKTSTDLKHKIFIQFRDKFALAQARVNSIELLDEMRTLRQEGVSIAASEGNKDDRAMAYAMACRAWMDQEMMGLVAQQRTRENERRRNSVSQQDVWELFREGMMNSFFAEREKERRMQRRAAGKRGSSRWGW